MSSANTNPDTKVTQQNSRRAATPNKAALPSKAALPRKASLSPPPLRRKTMEDNQVPCDFYSNGGCKNGDKCRFLHDHGAYAIKYQVHRCKDCQTAWCKGTRCAECRSRWHQCDSDGCDNRARNSDKCFKCKGYLECADCHFWFKGNTEALACPNCALQYGESRKGKNEKEEHEPYKCGGFNCKTMLTTGYRLCKECYQTEKFYTLPSRRQTHGK